MEKKGLNYTYPEIRFVLVEPSHPGNIGAAARAIKVMSWQNLYLVNPKKFPDDIAIARAAGAKDILNKTVVVKQLLQAIEDCDLIFGTSTRNREMSLPQTSSRNLHKLLKKENKQKIAILFGRESNGLSNEELNYCHHQIYIPANPSYSSLNLASAIQIIAYELANFFQQTNDLLEPSVHWATSKDYFIFYHYLSNWLPKIGFERNSVLNKIKNIFNRSKLSREEIHLLMGIFKNNSKQFGITSDNKK